MRRFVLAWALGILPLAACQRKDYVPQANQLNRFFWWSSSAPLTRAMNELTPEAASDVKVMLDHMARAEDAVLARIASGGSAAANDLVRVCESIPKRLATRYGESVERTYGIRGFPEPAVSCLTDISGMDLFPGEKSRHRVADVYEAILNRGLAVQAKIKQIAARIIDNYTSPSFPVNFEHKTESAVCVVHPACGVRVGKHWRVDTGIHNAPKDDQLPERGRQRIIEYARVLDGKLGDNLLMRLPMVETPTEPREDVTTLIATGRGSANPSCFRFIPPEENPAIIEALDLSDNVIQQAEDAVTPSSVAILVLPLGLNLVPIALLANVSSIATLLYVLISDVLTVIPLLIKGIELLDIAKQRHRAVVVRIGTELTGNGARPEAVSGETWAAECRSRGEYGTIGIVFISLSVTFLLAGIVLEYWARRYTQRKKRLKQGLYSDEMSTFREAGRKRSTGSSLPIEFLSIGAGNDSSIDGSYEWKM